MGVAVLLLMWAGYNVRKRIIAASDYTREQQRVLAELMATDTRTQPAKGQQARAPASTAAEASQAPELPAEFAV